MKEAHKGAMHALESLTEFEVDEKLLRQVNSAMPLLAQAYTLYEIVTEVMDISTRRHKYTIREIDEIIYGIRNSSTVRETSKGVKHSEDI